ncbi:MAG: TrkA family potassium uptake protein [Lachnospiraceae bacterium]|nr:TrkA family potassium uptake protein [Lachnospiraceae bacterium]
MKKSVAVLGLGKFGSSIARSLAKGGAEVLAVDKDEDLVRDIADKVTCAVCADISDKEMMNNIGLEGMDAVVIATAEHLDASVMALMIVKEIGVPYVLAKADGTLKGEILKRVGVDEIVYPEEEMGARIANNLLGGSMARKEWINKSLVDINFRGKYNVNVIAIEGEGGVDGAPDPTKPIKDEENLVLIGKKEDLVKLRK